MISIEVENELANWVKLIRHSRVILTDSIIERKAYDLINEFNTENNAERIVRIQFNNGRI